jgi:hypothetical protein
MNLLDMLLGNRTVYQCTVCDWVGTDAACTEQKIVHDDGRMERRWNSLCAKCFKPARYAVITNRDCDAGARLKLHADMETEEEPELPPKTARKLKEFKLYLLRAQVYRQRALESPITRKFFWRHAHDEINRARLARMVLRSEGVQI